MSETFARSGELTDIGSYPAWARNLAADCAAARRAVTHHELFQLMRQGELQPAQCRTFLIGIWPVIEQFPQYMALNLLKVAIGRAQGHEEARRYLIRNIRVEQNHADHWLAWAEGAGLAREELLHGEMPPETHALSHWCWHTCERDSLAAGMAATNYAIEGATGDWSAFVCEVDRFEQTFPIDARARSMKWLKLHAKYDDTHPWEALEIICTLVGTNPNRRYFELIRSRVITSYGYMKMALDKCLDTQRTISMPPFEVPEACTAFRERD